MIKRSDDFPTARTTDLVTERVGDELVIYDGASSEAHCLNALASAVFAAADGKTSTADLAAIASRELNETVDVPAVEQALVELQERGLVELLEVGGISRRGFMQRGAAVGGAVVAGSLVTSVVTPAYGATGSLPTGPPAGFSSLLVIIQQTSTGTLFGAHWPQGSSNGSSPDWGIGQANGNCPGTAYSVASSGASGQPTGITLTFVSGGVCVSGIPTGYTPVAYDAFFGNCPAPHGGQKCLSGTFGSPQTCGYVVSFATCY